MRTLLGFAAVAAIVTAVSCGSQDVNDLRRYGDAVAEQNQQVREPGSAGSQDPARDPANDPAGEPAKGPANGPANDPTGPGGESPTKPKPPAEVNPTAGDNVPSLRFKTSCYQPGNASCFLHQADSNNSGFYENLCRQGARDSQITKGRNACAALTITAKCSVNFRGDKLIFYNIGKLTKAKDAELTETCAGTEVLGQVIRGTYERFATPTDP